ncbi:hypothetical protein [Paenibacillus lutrae]|uniref:Uncharacterized protein n=1 Tax=Paenibacillus lutrae TaxID=2078573 RepID=A0A7X3FM60_9BACL|nr:hypothetical protein [Paenibacillus lutrae]MVP02293.1 hypothetical protein [Paenibacillus lutrae]
MSLKLRLIHNLLFVGTTGLAIYSMYLLLIPGFMDGFTSSIFLLGLLIGINLRPVSKLVEKEPDPPKKNTWGYLIGTVFLMLVLLYYEGWIMLFRAPLAMLICLAGLHLFEVMERRFIISKLEEKAEEQ